jgi:hypothetical protein
MILLTKKTGTSDKQMIDKPAIILTSIGRTGTKFFARLFSTLLPSCTSLHEPDIITLGRQSSLSKQLAEIGFPYILRKVFGTWSIAQISDKRLTGALTNREAAEEFLNQRKMFIESRPGPVYIESSLGYYGLLGILNDTFQSHRGVFIIRDGREWVRSFMDRGLEKRHPTYQKGPLMEKLTHTWPKASSIESDPYKNKWGRMNRFERLCWAWNTLNSFAIEEIRNNENIKLVYFEDLFESSQRKNNLLDMIDYLIEGDGIQPSGIDQLDSFLNIQPNSSMNEYPSWESWSKDQKVFFKATCLRLMKKMGYM